METTAFSAGGGTGDQMSAGTAMVTMERRMKMMKVMVAIDESDGSFYALRWALNNLFPTIGSVGAATPDSDPDDEGMVHLVHVQPLIHQAVYPVGPGGADALVVPTTAAYPTAVVADSIKKMQEERSAAVLSRAFKMCKDKLVRAESIILNGDPREMICQAVEQVQVDLLVMGSRGLGTLKRAFLGSVSDYCAHHAKAPTLIVKPPLEHAKRH